MSEYDNAVSPDESDDTLPGLSTWEDHYALSQPHEPSDDLHGDLEETRGWEEQPGAESSSVGSKFLNMISRLGRRGRGSPVLDEQDMSDENLPPIQVTRVPGLRMPQITKPEPLGQGKVSPKEDIRGAAGRQPAQKLPPPQTWV